MNLLISLRSEILKTKRTSSLYLTLIAAVFGPFMTLLDLLIDGVEREHRETLFNEMVATKFEMTGFALLPLFIILVCTLLPQIEYRNNAWKQLLTTPQPKSQIFIAKFLNIHLLILLFLFTNKFFMLLAAVILHFVHPELHLLSQHVDVSQAVMIVVNSYVGLMALSTIQYWLGLRFKNFIVPIGIGLSLWFLGSLLVISFKSDFSNYFPYSFHVLTSFPQVKADLTQMKFLSLGYSIFFLALGFVDFRRRKMVG